MVEVEAKFLLQDEGEAKRLLKGMRADGWSVRRKPPLEIVDRYRDTTDWQFLQAGWACRWREAGQNRIVGLKEMGVTEGLLQRREDLEQPVEAFPAAAGDLPPGEVASKLADLGGIEAREIFVVRNHRQLHMVGDANGGVISVAIDQVTITTESEATRGGPREVSFVELELELMAGPEVLLRDLAAVGRDRLGLLPSRLSKFERGLRLLGPAAKTDRDPGKGSTGKSARRRFRKRDRAGEFAVWAVQDQLGRIQAEEPVAWEGLDPEGVHQMRIAIRRTRVALRAFEPVLPLPAGKELDAELKWICSVLGTVRDFDVLRAQATELAEGVEREEAECLPAYREHLAKSWQDARRELVAAFASDRYANLRAKMTSLLEGRSPGHGTGTEEEGSIRELATRCLGEESKNVLRAGRALGPESPSEDFHALRADCKRLRYLIELFTPVYGKQLKSETKRVKRLQDELGTFHDACVATERLRDYAALVPVRARNRNLLLGLGQLIEAHRGLASRQRGPIRKAWKRFDRGSMRKKLLKLVR